MRVGIIALVVASTLGLSGCVVVDTAPQDGIAPPRQASSAPAPGGSSGKPGAKPSTSTAKPSQSKVDLSADRGTTYLAAHRASGLLSPPKVLGPWLVQWVIDGKTITYREILCTGTTVREATGTLGDGEDGPEVRWIDNGNGKADDPWVGNAATETTQLKITDERLKPPLQEEATSDIDGQTTTFVQHCQAAGEDVAEFLR